MNQLVINLKNLLPLGILLAFLAAIGHSDEGQTTAKAADAAATNLPSTGEPKEDQAERLAK